MVDHNNETKRIIALEEKLHNYEGVDRVIESREMQSKIAGQPKAISHYSGISILDKTLEGVQGGEVGVISGETGHGKTTLARTLTWNYEKKNKKCLWFSYEDTSAHFFNKFPELPSFYLPEKMISSQLDWIEERIIEGKIKFNTDIIFIDHLHYIIDFKMIASGNSSLFIGGVMRHLKKLALRHGIVIFLICHLAKVEPGKEPTLYNIRDSSFIGQESDFVMLVCRKITTGDNNSSIDATKETKVKIVKSRRTGRFANIYMLHENNLLIEDRSKDPVGEWENVNQYF